MINVMVMNNTKISLVETNEIKKKKRDRSSQSIFVLLFPLTAAKIFKVFKILI